MINNNKLIFNIIPISYSKFLDNCHSHSLNRQSKPSYPDLEIFRHSIVEDFHQFYHFQKKQGFVYQFIFYSLSVLFTFLAFIIYTKTTNWKCDFYFGNGELLKIFSYIFCLILSASAFGLGFLIRPEKETTQALVYKSKRHLNRIYKKYKRLNPFFLFFTAKDSVEVSSQSIYYQAIYTIEDQQEKTLQLLERIYLAKTLTWKIKEQLFNQAICELHETLNHILHSFQEGISQKELNVS